MKVTVTGKNENTLLKRKEVVFTVEGANIPPSRKEVREKIAALENAKPEQVSVLKIEHKFGSQEIEGKANIYASAQDLEAVELEYMQARNKGEKKGKKSGKEEAPAPKPAKAPAPEKPAEEKKEEAKTGEKPKAEKKEKPKEGEK